MQRLACAVLLLSAAACGEVRREPDATCDSPAERYGGTVELSDRLDVLFVVDTSPSMAEEKPALLSQIPDAARFLTEGWTRGGARWDLSRNVHVGVVSADLGGPAADGCSESGLDARLQGANGCQASRGDYVWHRRGYHDDADTGAAMSCIADLPEDSCTVSQPLEAALQAFGRNLDFESSTPNGPSALVLVIVTDRDDASPGTVQDFLRRFRSLRPGLDQYLNIVVVAGIPTDLLVRPRGEDVSDADAAVIYRRMLDDSRLLPSAANSPSCVTPAATAYAPRRLIELAAAWPTNVVLRSICDYDLSEALATVAGVIAKRLESGGPVCLLKPVARDADGHVPCRVTWELPSAVDPDEPFTPATCEDLPDVLSAPSGDLPTRTERGRTLCELRQAPLEHDAAGKLVPKGEGFYLEPSTPLRLCTDTSPGMIQWTPKAIPPPGVRLVVECGEDPVRHVAGTCDRRPTCLGPGYSCDDERPRDWLEREG
ncbi:MAG TPA: hypothetical protein VJV78_33250 [Polyangiales bacterium]|nr:hypothetical protein [Polyangiales bacterium]